MVVPNPTSFVAVKEIVESMRPEGERNGVAVGAEYAPDRIVIDGDRFALGRVFRNLITNAIHHAKTEVTVLAQRLKRPDGAVARIAVQDDGPGISDEELHLVFDLKMGIKSGVDLHARCMYLCILDQAGQTLLIR